MEEMQRSIKQFHPFLKQNKDGEGWTKERIELKTRRHYLGRNEVRAALSCAMQNEKRAEKHSKGGSGVTTGAKYMWRAVSSLV